MAISDCSDIDCRLIAYSAILDRLVFGIADPYQVAFNAFRLARLADPPAVPDQLVREEYPSVSGNYGHQVLFDFLGFAILRQIETP
jgi:hypothetical protein